MSKIFAILYEKKIQREKFHKIPPFHVVRKKCRNSHSRGTIFFSRNFSLYRKLSLKIMRIEVKYFPSLVRIIKVSNTHERRTRNRAIFTARMIRLPATETLKMIN